MTTNSDRADWAIAALEAFAEQTGQDKSGDLANEPATVVGDLLTDLMHYCGQNGLDFTKILKDAKRTYEEELAEDDDDGEEEADEAAAD